MMQSLEACVLPVRELGRALGFYRDLLGFDVEFADDERAILRVGGSEIVLLSLDAAAREPKFAGAVPGGGMAIHVRVADPDGLWEVVSKTAGVLERLGDRDYGDRDFSILDPDGYRLVFGSAVHG